MPQLYFKIESDVQKVIQLREEITKLKTVLSGMDGNTSPATFRAMEVQLSKNTKELDNLIVTAARAGNEIDHNFKKKIFDASQSVSTFSDKIIDQRAVIRDIEFDVKNLSTAYSKLNKFDPNRGKMLAELNASRSALTEEKAVLFGLQQEQSKARLSVKRLRDEYALYNNEGRSVATTNQGMSISFGKVLGVIGGVGVLKELASEITTVTGQFQRFDNVLTNALGGDNNKAKQYLGDIADFAAKTNFQLDELTDNFLKFVNRGVTPSMESMTKLGDFTNSVSKPYAQLSEAILDINNPERWKEFGVQVQTNGSKVNLTFRGMKIEADRTVESVMNAIEQFGSMDGIKGSTEAIAGTIEGQMSNLQDTITSVLNEIGQANSEVISGGISITSELIQNYDKVGRVIVGLIATYGTYRTAVMLATAAENGHSIAMLLTRDRILLVRRAQQLLNATMLANPYVAVTTLVVGLAAAMWALSESTTAVEQAQKKFSERMQNIENDNKNRKIQVDKLISVIQDETAAETDRYKAIQELRRIVPEATKNMSDEAIRTGALTEQKKKYNEELSKQIGLEKQRELNQLYAQKKSLESSIKTDRGTKGYKYQYRADQDQLILNEVDRQIAKLEKEKADFFKLKEQSNQGTKLSSISDEIKAITEKISTLKQSLADLRSGKAQAEAGKTVQAAIEEKTKELKAADDALATLTGQTTKESDKRLSIQQELSRSILDSELKLQAGRISAMQDGKAKRIALAEQEYRETIATIQKEKEEYQKKIKETKGKEDPTVISSFNNRETAAGDKKNTDVAKVEKEYAEEYKQRTKALADVFLNEEQRKLSAIKDRYTQEKKWADEQLKTGGMSQDEHKTYTVNIDKAQSQETYRSLLDNLNDYKQKEKDLRDKWDTNIAAAVEAKDAYLVAKLREGKEKALSSLNSQMLQESTEWMRLFGNLDTLTVDELNKLIDSIQKQLDSGTLTLNPVDAKALMDSLNQAKEKVAQKNPFTALAKSSGEMKAALKELEAAEKSGLTGEQLDVYKKKVKDAADNVKKSISAIRDAYGEVSDVMRSAAELIDMVDEGLGETVNNAISLGDAVMNIGEVVANAVIAFANGMSTMESASVILLIIKAVLLAVMAAIALFNGDKKHEKKIKQLQEEVDKLKNSYDRLGEAIEDAYSTDKADLIDKASENLRQQNELIQQQIKEEEDKKKTDKDKIKDWQDTIEENNRQIENNSKKGRVEAIMGSDIKSAIDEFAQAYADAWASGEKAAGKSADIVKNLIRTSIIEMLKSELKPEVEAFMTFLSGAMADGIIDAAEQRTIDEWEKKLEGIADITLAGKDKWLKGDNSDQLGITPDSLSDTITDGLKSGKSGIKDFASSFEDMMKTAVLNSLKTKYLEGPLKEFQKKFAELSESGGQLTEAEIEELRGMYADIIDGAKVQFDAMKDISGLDFTMDSDNSLKGAYAKASEESIDLLAGQTGAVRVILEDVRGSIQPIREQMQLIYNLQREGWQDVKAIRELTDKVEKNTAQVAENTKEIKTVADKVEQNTRNTVDALEGTINVKIKGM